MASGKENESESTPIKANDCIQLELLGSSFRPEFTHQCFPNEALPGGPQEIRVQLAPSGRSCAVSSKRRKLETMAETVLSLEQIREHISLALPPITDSTADDFLEQPVGDVQKEYSRGSDSFVVSMASGPEPYHNLVQPLALWFIETADAVELTSDWKVCYLWKKHGDDKFSLVGYVTLFHFSSPFRKPRAGTVVRICQVLLLPPYQRQGHGRVLLECVYDYARSTESIVEVNVEDPAPSFTALRNKVDYELYHERVGLEALTDERVEALMNETKLTKRQLVLVHEMNQYRTCSENNDEKEFRLRVKRRLNREHKEELGGLDGDKDAMKALLSKYYEEQVAGYRAIVSKK